MSDDQLRSQMHENYSISNLNTGEKYTNHHYIQVEPISTFKRPSSPVKHQQIIDIQPNIIVQHQRATSKPDSESNIRVSSTKLPLSEVYVEQDNNGAQISNIETMYANNANDTGSTIKQYVNEQQGRRGSLSSPPSPVTEELNRIWRNKHSMRSPTTSQVVRKNTKTNRPPGRLKNYEDESDSESTATETPSREDGT
jgi:hypothetical protein